MSPRILLVEDDPDQASLFANVLTIVGYEVVTASSAETALTYMTEHTFDLALVDWDLPCMKGDTLIFRNKQEYPGMRSILYSNHAAVDQVAGVCGADAWMRKSEGIQRLRDIVAGLVK